MKKTIKILTLLLVTTLATVKTYAQVSIGLSVHIAPPALPVYTQPPCPVDGYLWTPGYWAYTDDGGYYWVPGVWVAPPRVGFLWTPGYWGYDGGIYIFHQGYWGRHIGFYGGVNYGYGYGGAGYVGGRWAGNSFQYNTAVVNVNNTVVHNTYVNKTVINNNVTVNNNRTSFNGPGGVNAQARPEELAAAREQHVQPTNDQINHQQVAGKDHNQFASANNGHPATAAMNKVGGNRFNTEGRRARASSPDATNNNADRGNRQQVNNNADNHANQDNVNRNAPSADQTAKAPHQWQTANNLNAGNNRQPAQNQQRNNMARAPRQLVRHPAPGRPHNNPRPQEHERHR
ncbi:YXWGXW repeat-containing protein [Mucilaginibacter sp. NFX135]|uniref:YXWGXW repeat-containing protein n=1 Tax=Mucilaginibacter sp. NFX135 TaxID=3402687 RepID=UPI003AFA38FC